MAVSQIVGLFGGCPYNKVLLFQGSKLGTMILGNSHMYPISEQHCDSCFGE